MFVVRWLFVLILSCNISDDHTNPKMSYVCQICVWEIDFELWFIQCCCMSFFVVLSESILLLFENLRVKRFVCEECLAFFFVCQKIPSPRTFKSHHSSITLFLTRVYLVWHWIVHFLRKLCCLCFIQLWFVWQDGHINILI